MPLESTMICVDNSEFMRNGDYAPTRLQAQQDAVNTVCRFKLMANPENNVGLLTLAQTEVLATLTTDAGKILTSLHKVQPQGLINVLTGIRIAHLALKHRQSKNHKMRIVVFVGSPISSDDKDVTKIAKRLKKENVNIDIISFGETENNQGLLETLVNTINGREGTGSHLVTVPPSPHLADALISSPIIQGEDGAGVANIGSVGGFDFGVDPNEDPELVLALRVSMEEQRQRQQDEQRRAAQEGGGSTGGEGSAAPAEGGDTTAMDVAAPATGATDEVAGASEDEMLQQALAMSLEPPGEGVTAASSDTAATPAAGGSVSSAGSVSVVGIKTMPDFSVMTEEEQIAYAMQISLQGCQTKEVPMEVEGGKDVPKEGGKGKTGEKDDDLVSQVISNPELLQEVLQDIPGVDPQSQEVLQAVGSLTGQKEGKEGKKKKKEEEDEKMEEGDDKS